MGGAFGNMCRSGRMFAPTKTYRRWHRKINKTQKRQALASCLAATACAPLVEARGHKISDVKEIPCVVDGLESISRTADALACLTALGMGDELEKCKRNLLANKKSRWETFRGFSLDECESRKRKAES